MVELSDRALKARLRTIDKTNPVVKWASIDTPPKALFEGAKPMSRSHIDSVVVKLIVTSIKLIGH